MAEKKEDSGLCIIHSECIGNVQTQTELKLAKCESHILECLRKALEKSSEDIEECFKDEEKRVNALVADHETRIRAMEANMAKWLGIFLVASFIIQLIGVSVATYTVRHIMESDGHNKQTINRSAYDTKDKIVGNTWTGVY